MLNQDKSIANWENLSAYLLSVSANGSLSFKNKNEM